MSYGDILDRIQALVKLGGWAGVQPPPDYAKIAKRGYIEFVRYTGGNNEPTIINTVVGQVSYPTIQNDPTQPNYDPRVWCNFWDSALYNYIPSAPGSSWPLPQQTRNRMQQLYPMFLDTAVGQPTWWYYDKGNTNSIGLWPPPSDNNVAILFWGIRELPPMTDPDDQTPFSEMYDEAIALYGAWYWGKLYSRGAERQIAMGYKAEADKLGDQFKGEITKADGSLVQRTVALPGCEYIGAGSSRYTPFVGPYFSGNQSNGTY